VTLLKQESAESCVTFLEGFLVFLFPTGDTIRRPAKRIGLLFFVQEEREAAIMVSAAMSQNSRLTVNIFDGTRQPFSQNKSILYTIFNGDQKQLFRDERNSAVVPFDLPFYNNFGDNYRVIAYSDDYYQAGYTPLPLTPAHPTNLDLMLLPKTNSFNFANARWDTVKSALPFLANGVSEDEGANRYTDLMENKPKSLAALLNITTAMGQIFLSGSDTPLSHIKQVVWDKTLAQDRFFAYADKRLIDEVRAAAHRGVFAPEPGAAIFHPGATASWKQVLFGQGDVQLTFHENDPQKNIDGIDCVLLEPDIDLYKDLGAHFLLEVLPNKITGGLTNPEAVYVLRWIAGQQHGVPEFAPPFTIVAG
jgi:hypothetical protein